MNSLTLLNFIVSDPRKVLNHEPTQNNPSTLEFNYYTCTLEYKTVFDAKHMIQDPECNRFKLNNVLYVTKTILVCFTDKTNVRDCLQKIFKF